MSTEEYQQPDAYSVFEEMEEEGTLIYAQTIQRFVNYVVDTIVWFVLFLAFFFCVGIVQRVTGKEILSVFVDEYGEGTVWLMIVSLVLWVGMYTFLEAALKGRTIGKLVTGTRALNDDGTDLGLKRAFIRSLCRIIPFDSLSALGGHPWHDTVSKTMVVKKKSLNA